jgi:hypothetical protein
MTCVRCGNCCFYLIVTVSPKYINEDVNLKTCHQPEDMFICVDGINEFCPYLSWDNLNNQAHCKVHNKTWFKDTGCHRYMNLEYEPFKCKIGPHIRSNEETFENLKNKIKQHQIGDNIDYI